MRSSAPRKPAFDKIDDEDEQGADKNPGELVPIKERDVAEHGLDPVVGRHQNHRDQGHEEKQARQIAPPTSLRRLVLHGAASSLPRLVLAAASLLKAWRER